MIPHRDLLLADVCAVLWSVSVQQARCRVDLLQPRPHPCLSVCMLCDYAAACVCARPCKQVLLSVRLLRHDDDVIECSALLKWLLTRIVSSHKATGLVREKTNDETD